MSHPRRSATAFIRQLHKVLRSTRASLRGGAPMELDPAMERAEALLAQVKARRGTVLCVGNGGSQVIAEHLEMDLCNRAAMGARAFTSTPVITALCNDHAHEEAYARLVRSQARPGDLLVAISSSGRSPNILAAARAAERLGLPVITFSGFDPDNGLRALGDLNFWVDSHDYSLVELAHESLAHHLSDGCVAAEMEAVRLRRETEAEANAKAEAEAEAHAVAPLAPARIVVMTARPSGVAVPRP